MFESGGSDANTFFYNNVCFGRQEISVGTEDYNAVVTPPSKLGWTHHLVTGFSRNEYVSLSENDAIAPRRGDGSMPSRFARLMPGSNLVDAGGVVPASVIPNWNQLITDFPFLDSPASGNAHDIGPYELKQGNPDSLNPVIDDPSPITNKILRNGQILILRGDKAYTITGLEIRE
jgi:hypothetical protein